MAQKRHIAATELTTSLWRSGSNQELTYNIRSFSGGDIESDDDLVMISFQDRLQKTKKADQVNTGIWLKRIYFDFYNIQILGMERVLLI